jgi:hypothetical protein
LKPARHSISFCHRAAIGIRDEGVDVDIPKDTVFSAQIWPKPSTESSEEAIDPYEERAKPRRECRPPFSDASQIDKKAQLGQISSCRQFGFAAVRQ